MKTFKQLAEDNARDAVKFKRIWTTLNYVALALALFCFLTGFALALGVPSWGGKIGAILSLGGVFSGFFLFMARSARRQGRESFDDFMRLRDECLDLAQRFK